MTRWLALPIATLSLTATTALAAPCQTEGVAEEPIAFPKNDESDVPFARSMVWVMLPHVSDALPRDLSCTRLTMSTALGEYVLGGENGEDIPRVALRADGNAGPVAYLAASPEAPGSFALVVYSPDAPTIVKQFYAGIPSDRRLAEDVRAALADSQGIMAYDARRTMVMYGFGDGPPPPVEPGKSEHVSVVDAGPQILIADSGDMRLLDIADDMRHLPSGFACPSTFDGLSVLLMRIDPRADYLSCEYRAGSELRYRQDDPMRYQVILIKARPDDTTRGVFDQMTADGRATLRIKGNHTPPLATGPAPAPELVTFWDTAEDVQGLWAGKAGGWIVLLRAQYPQSAASDTEAGEVAQILFSQIAQQVR
jgi:hypothetical protein